MMFDAILLIALSSYKKNHYERLRSNKTHSSTCKKPVKLLDISKKGDGI